MTIVITLEEVLVRASDWDAFCEEKGYSVWCVNEGGGDNLINLSEKEAIKYGIIKGGTE